MSVLVLLIFASLAIATAFLLGFIWAVRSGQYEDTCTPSMRVLMEDVSKAGLTPTGTGKLQHDLALTDPDTSHLDPAKKRPTPGKGRVGAKSSSRLNSPA